MPRDERSCVLCDGGDDEGRILLCDDCDKPVHAHCVWASPAQSKAAGFAASARISPPTPKVTRAKKRKQLSPRAREQETATATDVGVVA